jgi:hypothetical protein
MCVGSFNLEQNRDLEKHYSMLQGVGNFGFKQDHNATWRSIWNNKTCYKNATKLENFLSESFCFKFFFYLLAFSSFSCFFFTFELFIYLLFIDVLCFFYFFFLFFHVCALLAFFLSYDVFYFGFGFFNLCVFKKKDSFSLFIFFLYIYNFFKF